MKITKKVTSSSKIDRLFLLPVALLAVASVPADGSMIFASGQKLVPGDPAIPPGEPGHDDSRENYVYSIDVATGIATPVSPVTTGLPSALGGSRNQELYGFKNGELMRIGPTTGSQQSLGNNGLRSTAFEILPDGRAFILPFNDDFDTQQLYQIDLTDGMETLVSLSETEIGDAIDLSAGNSAGTTGPFVISLGAVGDILYGVDLDSDSLIALSPDTGRAGVVGPVGAVGAVTDGDTSYFGFSALTGVDETGDGVYDSLFGAVNFARENGETERLGGVARFDLTDGSWELVGTNPGVIFFGMGSSPVPEPSTMILLSLAITTRCFRRRRIPLS